MDDAAEIWEAERALLDPAVRRDRDAVATLLADGFHEIGQSGRRWTRAAILDLLESEEPVAGEPVLTDRQERVIADGIVLLTYRLRYGGRDSLRSSLWEVRPPRLLFHQGTPIRTVVE